MYLLHNNEARLLNPLLPWKSNDITYSECVFVALDIQHGRRMRGSVLSFMACPAIPFLPHCLINGMIFGKHSLDIKCVFWFSLRLSPETFFSLRKSQRDTVINVLYIAFM
jgi:hypothetical protein